jgi:hypothetical protein
MQGIRLRKPRRARQGISNAERGREEWLIRKIGNNERRTLTLPIISAWLKQDRGTWRQLEIGND